MSRSRANTEKRRNAAVFASCFAVVGLMVGAAYAAVPLYYMFCAATGYGGTPSRAAAAPGAVSSRMMTVRFDTNVDPGLPWAFVPEQRAVKVHIGEDKLVFFRAENRSDHAIVGHASFNVQPEQAARYFNKIQCFCFTQQTLKPGETVEMPVTFFVDPDIDKNSDLRTVKDITLSYTFFASKNKGS